MTEKDEILGYASGYMTGFVTGFIDGFFEGKYTKYDSEHQDLGQKLAELVLANKSHTMESAPKNGKDILVHDPEKIKEGWTTSTWQPAFWSEFMYPEDTPAWISSVDHSIIYNPTKWRSMPEE